MKLAIAFLLADLGLASTRMRPRDSPAPYHNDFETDLVDDEYIVRLEKNYKMAQHYEFVGRNLSETEPMFHPLGTINGYFIRTDRETMHDLVRRDPGVKNVEHNRRLSDTDYEKTPETHVSGVEQTKRWEVEEQLNTPWWIRMCQSSEKLEINPRVLGTGYALKDAGAGVDVFIFDSGIDINHPGLDGMAMNFKKEHTSRYCDESNEDVRNHGTSVAYQVHKIASKAILVNVKVRCDKGNFGNILLAMQDAIDLHNWSKAHRDQRPGWKGSVWNFSWGGPNLMGMGEFLMEAFQIGIPIAASAGNLKEEIKKYPCSSKFVKCVGSVDMDYKMSEFSDFGPKVNIFAPGGRMIMASTKSKNGWDYNSGTSFAAPLVAGMFATFKGYEGHYDDARFAYKRLDDNALVNMLGGLKGSVNLLANTGINSPFKRFQDPYYMEEYYGRMGPGPVGAASKDQVDNTTTQAEKEDVPSASDATLVQAKTDGPPLVSSFSVKGATATFTIDAAAPTIDPDQIVPVDMDDIVTATISGKPEMTATPCEGNQVQGDCVQANLGPASDSGFKTPVCMKSIGKQASHKLMNKDAAKAAANKYCADLINGGIVLDASNTVLNPLSYDGAVNGGKITALILFDKESCPPKKEQKLDFKAMGLETCVTNLYATLAQFCGMDSNFQDYNKDFTLEGGSMGIDCAIWTMFGL
ncbi:subtilisin-like protein [Corynespora cassiicola Philippines]|uniref:Subtilisin-like protein n=1 Tax=Corynespora cassiicola Philippines TaxID=1448308 RepID=A0A2T2NSA2_CORCC|nr:subtilisin-like protein [Corynespora cassiicola Philippines]